MNQFIKKIAIAVTILHTFSIAGQTILGIDVSHHQGDIDWDLVSSDGKVYAYVKATEGKDFIDSKFEVNMTNGVNAGVIMGAYHFARPDNNTAIEDATHFLSIARDYIGPGFLPPTLDVEDAGSVLSSLFTPAQLTAWIQEWFDYVETQTGIRPIIYSNTNYASYVESSINTYGLWIAKPGSDPSEPPTSLGVWTDWAIKQYSWTGSVLGINGDTDLNVFNGTSDDFDAFTNSTGTTLWCYNAIELNCWETYSGESSSAISHVSSYGCSSPNDQLGPERVHTITPQTDGTLSASLSNFTGDLNVYILGSCDPDDCLGTIGESSAEYTNAVANTTYYVVVDGVDINGSGYDLTVMCTTSSTDDITLSNTSVESTFVNPGDNIIASSDQIYTGNQLNADLPGFDLTYYLSTDCALSDEDILLGSSISELGSDNLSVSKQETLSIPGETNPGIYYLLFRADDNDELFEYNEYDNSACIQIEINSTPVASNDNALTNESDLVIIDVLSNDRDNDNNLDISTLRIVDQPSQGTAVVQDGKINYTANSGISVSDILTYDVSDSLGLQSDQATVSIIINRKPNVVDDQDSVEYLETITIEVLANDSDPNNNLKVSSLEIINAPISGTAEIDANGIKYTSTGGDAALDSLTYRLSDVLGLYSDTATVSIWINLPPPPLGNVKGRSQIKLYPNPSQDDVTLVLESLDRTKSWKVSVYNLDGKVLIDKNYQVNEVSNKVNLNTTDLKQGLYFVKISSDEDVFILKMIKE